MFFQYASLDVDSVQKRDKTLSDKENSSVTEYLMFEQLQLHDFAYEYVMILSEKTLQKCIKKSVNTMFDIYLYHNVGNYTVFDQNVSLNA